jgi:hypothetical protein
VKKIVDQFLEETNNYALLLGFKEEIHAVT